MIARTPFVRARIAATALLALGIATGASASITLGPAADVPIGAQPSGVAVADFDGDGDLDVASTVNGPDRVAVLLNDGTGALVAGPASFLPASSSPSDLVAGDLDGDGDVDLAVTVRDPAGAVLILANGGAATFTLVGTVTVGDRPRGLSIGDVEPDGDLDLAVANRDGGSASVLLNTGGAFSATTFAVGVEPRDTAFGDFDLDGDLDLAVTESDGRAVHLYTSAAGAFSPSTVLSVAPFVRPDGVIAGDVTGDGRVDLAVAVSDQTLGINQAMIFTGGAGGFTGPVGFDTGGTNTSDLLAADLDCDGDLDLVTTNVDSNDASVLENTGGGAFGPAAVLPVGAEPGRLAAGDLDDDGDADVAVEAKSSNAISILDNGSCDGVPCPSDVNGNGLVDVADLVAVILAWNTANVGADVTGDGFVDVSDLVQVILDWGACP